MVLTFGYWDTRGRGEEARLLLSHAGQPWEDKRYSMAAGDEGQVGKDWFGHDKQNLGLDFPNLPYLLDGDVKLTQSIAIIRYLGRKFGLVGQNEAEQLRVELAEQQVSDLKGGLLKVAYDHANFATSSVEHKKNLPGQLKRLEDFLGDRKFVIGDKVTYADFCVYVALDFLRLWSEESFAGLEKLIAFQSRIEELPGVKEYLASPKYERKTLTSPFAVWGCPAK